MRARLPWILTVALGLAGLPAAAEDPPRLRRADSFLGIHFDFHAGDDCTDVGRRLTPEMVEAVIDLVRPDYIQVDSKGHPGVSSYPTEIGHPAPGFVRDPLKIWREVTARRGVALYVHHSGVWDAAAVRAHSDWARLDPEGKPDDRLTSVFGPYVDRLLIPQLKELRLRYGVDGVWVDGECWAVERDYRPEAVRRFQESGGWEHVPRTPGEPGWEAYSEFNRDGFRRYLSHYVDALHRFDPAFQIASNWAYSSMMPEPVAVDVDFISGDFSATDSVNSARFEARAMVHQGKPWDLMAWSFTWTDGLYSTKSVPQMQQEAAVVIALGGGFQAYFPQRRDASVRLWQMDLMSKVAKFCRERQSFSHRSTPVPQIGLIYSGRAFYRVNRKLFAAWHGELTPLRGTLQCLLDGQNIVDVVMEHHLAGGRMREYPLLVWPEWSSIEPDFRDDLLRYVREGGRLLVVGPDAADLFAADLGITWEDAAEKRVNGLAWGGHIAGVNARSRRVRLDPDVRPFGEFRVDPRDPNDFAAPASPAASIRTLGKGQLAAVYLDLGERYAHAATSVARDFLTSLVRELFPEPAVEVVGSRSVDVTLQRAGTRTVVHLVNTAGPHGDARIHVFDEIPPVGPLQIRIRHPRPSRVILEPGGEEPVYDYVDGAVRLQLPRLEIHRAVVLVPPVPGP